MNRNELIEVIKQNSGSPTWMQTIIESIDAYADNVYNEAYSKATNEAVEEIAKNYQPNQ